MTIIAKMQVRIFRTPYSTYITRRRRKDSNVNIYANADITIYRYVNI